MCRNPDLTGTSIGLRRNGSTQITVTVTKIETNHNVTCDSHHIEPGRAWYGRPAQFGPIDLRRRTQALREDLMAKIVELSPWVFQLSAEAGHGAAICVSTIA